MFGCRIAVLLSYLVPMDLKKYTVNMRLEKKSQATVYITWLKILP